MGMSAIGVIISAARTAAPSSFEHVIDERQQPAPDSHPWTGNAGDDETPPTVSVSQASVTKLRRPARSYVLRVALSVEETSESVVRYRIAVNGNGTFLASRLGVTQSGRVSAAIRIRAPRSLRRLGVVITASDRLGNESRVSRDVTMPRRHAMRRPAEASWTRSQPGLQQHSITAAEPVGNPTERRRK
jgi:hypothetical protein